VFDGHCGICAATFARNRLLDNIFGQPQFPDKPEDAIVSSCMSKHSLAHLVLTRSLFHSQREACLLTDQQFEEACSSLPEEASGTTAIVALVLGKKIIVANIGDSRAVLSRRGQAVELSHDQKPILKYELERIQKVGGFVDEEGFLNGQLAVSRAIGDWHLEDLKRRKDGSPGPLIAEPEVSCHAFTGDDDEFMILASDGLWDVFSSQGAITFARDRLLEHNDPAQCSRDLIAEAMERHTTDNVSVTTVCFSSGPPRELRQHGAGGDSAAQGGKMIRALSSTAMQALQQSLTDAEDEMQRKQQSQ